MINFKYYSDLSKKENRIVLIAVHKDAVMHVTIEKEAFKSKNMQLLICQGLIKGLEKKK